MRGAGLIPAHAGKTGRTSRVAASAWAHPRSRGENLDGSGAGPGFAGSSPLTRGKLTWGMPDFFRHGLIPAHAGKTRPRCTHRPARRAHPRSHGENTVHVRGFHAVPGLIPAHAGKTGARARFSRRSRAHPRSRGENESAACASRWWMGSSPLTRGKRSARSRSSRTEGLIPAHAGKTELRTGHRGWHGAHPRSRGENPRQGRDGRERSGSSPLTRGKLYQHIETRVISGLIPAHAGKRGGCDACPERWGLIPAHAGKTDARVGLDGGDGAHPRSRGENLSSLAGRRAREGSSPLTRGKLLQPDTRQNMGGLIPAHAGKTSSRARVTVL